MGKEQYEYGKCKRLRGKGQAAKVQELRAKGKGIKIKSKCQTGKPMAKETGKILV
jgi:hypothetical protein